MNNAVMLWICSTCGCSFHLAYDDTLPGDQRVLTVITQGEAELIHIQRRQAGINCNPNPVPPAHMCKDHAQLGYTTARYNQVFAESQTVDTARSVYHDLREAQIKNASGSIFDQVIQIAGNESLERTIWGEVFNAIPATFDASRVLIIIGNNLGLSATDMTSMQTAIINKLGAGRVKFE